MTSECLFTFLLHTSFSLLSFCWITTELLKWLPLKSLVFLQCRLHAVSTHKSPRCTPPVVYLPHSRAFRDPSLPAKINNTGDPGVQEPCHVTKIHFSHVFSDCSCRLPVTQSTRFLYSPNCHPTPTHPSLACSLLFSEPGASLSHPCFFLCTYPSKHASREEAQSMHVHCRVGTRGKG